MIAGEDANHTHVLSVHREMYVLAAVCVVYTRFGTKYSKNPN